jgi:hypothetical protein
VSTFVAKLAGKCATTTQTIHAPKLLGKGLGCQLDGAAVDGLHAAVVVPIGQLHTAVCSITSHMTHVMSRHNVTGVSPCQACTACWCAGLAVSFPLLRLPQHDTMCATTQLTVTGAWHAELCRLRVDSRASVYTAAAELVFTAVYACNHAHTLSVQLSMMALQLQQEVGSFAS